MFTRCRASLIGFKPLHVLSRVLLRTPLTIPISFWLYVPNVTRSIAKKNTERITYGSMEISRAVGMNTAFRPAILWKYFATIRPEGGGHMGLMNVLLCTAKAVEKNPCQSLSVRKRDRLGQVLKFARKAVCRLSI
jgi:hypothetical protein